VLSSGEKKEEKVRQTEAGKISSLLHHRNLPTSIPASIKVSSWSTFQQAGPIVQIILVRRIVSSVVLVIIGISIKPPDRVGTWAVLEILIVWMKARDEERNFEFQMHGGDGLREHLIRWNGYGYRPKVRGLCYVLPL